MIILEKALKLVNTMSYLIRHPVFRRIFIQLNAEYRIIKNSTKIFIIYALANLISSCGITHLPADVQKSITQTESGIESANTRLSLAKNIEKNNFIEHTSVGYFGNQVITSPDTDFLPPLFNNKIQIDRQFFGMKAIANGLTDLTNVPTVLDINFDAQADSCSEVRIIQQEGNLIDLLNAIGARCDISWAYRNGKIILSDTETKTWSVKNIPGDIQVQNQINNNTGLQSQSGANGSSTGTTGAGSTTGQSQAQSQQTTTQNVAFNLTNSLWTNLQDGVKNILSKNGKYTVNPSTSSLTVTDRPSVILRVDRYMKNQNDIMSRQVQVDIQILSVDVDSTDNYGINWGVALNGSNASFSINGQAVSQGSSGGSTFVPSPVFVPSATTQAFTVGVNSGDLSGSQLVINALSTIAKTSLVTSTAVTTLSNQPVPVQFVEQQGYLASVTTTQTAQVGSQTALTPGQITTGLSLNVLPVIQSDGAVFMQLSINISSLKQISQFSSQGASIQLPETLQRNLMQKAVIRSGDCFVVTGFDSENQSINNTGVGGAYEWLLGGGVSSNKNRTRMVILVTPRVVSI
jgi:type IVB pilus formation R64 PilN family outer membrane protein